MLRSFKRKPRTHLDLLSISQSGEEISKRLVGSVNVFFCFRFFAFTEAAPRQSHAVQLPDKCLRLLVFLSFFLFVFGFIGDVAFSAYFCAITFFLCVENTPYVFHFRMVLTGFLY